MNKDQRKALLDAYKNRAVTGGIYCIQCSGNQRKWLRSTTDMEGARSRAMFSLRMKGAPEPSMQRECNAYGCESFSFIVLEELTKKSTQTDQEFADDIATLYEIWLAKYADGELA